MNVPIKKNPKHTSGLKRWLIACFVAEHIHIRWVLWCSNAGWQLLAYNSTATAFSNLKKLHTYIFARRGKMSKSLFLERNSRSALSIESTLVPKRRGFWAHTTGENACERRQRWSRMRKRLIGVINRHFILCNLNIQRVRLHSFKVMFFFSRNRRFYKR